MAAGSYNVTAEQGSTFKMNFTLYTGTSPWNLTSYTARMQVRTDKGASSTLLSLTNGNGITLGGALGTVAIVVPATTMAGVIAGRHVYDLEIQSSGGEVWRVLEGKFVVKAEVTR